MKKYRPDSFVSVFDMSKPESNLSFTVLSEPLPWCSSSVGISSPSPTCGGSCASTVGLRLTVCCVISALPDGWSGHSLLRSKIDVIVPDGVPMSVRASLVDIVETLLPLSGAGNGGVGMNVVGMSGMRDDYVVRVESFPFTDDLGLCLATAGIGAALGVAWTSSRALVGDGEGGGAVNWGGGVPSLRFLLEGGSGEESSRHYWTVSAVNVETGGVVGVKSVPVSSSAPLMHGTSLPAPDSSTKGLKMAIEDREPSWRIAGRVDADSWRWR